MHSSTENKGLLTKQISNIELNEKNGQGKEQLDKYYQRLSSMSLIKDDTKMPYFN